METLENMIFEVIGSGYPFQELLLISLWLITFFSIKGKLGLRALTSGAVAVIFVMVLSRVVLLTSFTIGLSWAMTLVGIWLFIQEGR